MVNKSLWFIYRKCHSPCYPRTFTMAPFSFLFGSSIMIQIVVLSRIICTGAKINIYFITGFIVWSEIIYFFLNNFIFEHIKYTATQTSAAALIDLLVLVVWNKELTFIVNCSTDSMQNGVIFKFIFNSFIILFS